MDEVALAGHLGIVAQRLVVLVDQLAAQLVGIAGRSLPEEGGQVVIVGAAAAALVVYEVGLSLAVKHHVACLEVAVEETVGRFGRQVAREHTEVGLELEFVEVELSSLEETVLEVVEVEAYTVLVELWLRIADRPVEPAGTAQLYIGQFADGAEQELALVLVVAAAGIAPALEGIVERGGAEVGLQIAQLVVAHGKDSGDGQLAGAEVAGKVDEGVVLVAAGAHHADNRVAVGIIKTVIGAVAAGSRQGFYPARGGAAPRCV